MTNPFTEKKKMTIQQWVGRGGKGWYEVKQIDKTLQRQECHQA